MNQAFGDQPKYEITWHRKKAGHPACKGPKIDSEFFLIYSRSDEPTYNTVFRPLSSEEASAYVPNDERGQYRAADLTAPFDHPTARFTWRGYQPPPRRSWRFALDRLETLAQENRILFPSSGGLPRLKQYLNDHPGVEMGTTWDDIPARHEHTRYAVQTPLALMERILQLASNTGDRVLDPFCGSGTTLVAAQSLGRRWWGADSSVEAYETTVECLITTCGLEARKDYAVLKEADVIDLPIVDASYRDVIASVGEIAKLQQDIGALTNHLHFAQKADEYRRG